MGVVKPFSGKPRYNPPRPINADDRLEAFDCGKEALDDWLKLPALENEGTGLRTYVVTARVGRAPVEWSPSTHWHLVL